MKNETKTDEPPVKVNGISANDGAVVLPPTLETDDKNQPNFVQIETVEVSYEPVKNQVEVVLVRAVFSFGWLTRLLTKHRFIWDFTILLTILTFSTD